MDQWEFLASGKDEGVNGKLLRETWLVIEEEWEEELN